MVFSNIIVKIITVFCIVYMSYDISDNFKKIITNTYFQFIWLIGTFWVYNTNKEIGVLMGLLFIVMRKFIGNNSSLEKFSNGNIENNGNNGNSEDETMREIIRKHMAALEFDESKTQLSKDTIREIINKYNSDVVLTLRQNLDNTFKCRSDGSPEQVGLPEPVDTNVLDFQRLVDDGNVISF